ncbi:hypothetical protein NW752_009472 [Fusarium irregulare]|nr:hypothetical protein NW752_009472 [Fusarium irregulare]
MTGVGLLCLCGCGCERHKGSSDVPVVEMHVITAVVAAHGRDTAAFDRDARQRVGVDRLTVREYYSKSIKYFANQLYATGLCGGVRGPPFVRKLR